MPSLSAIVFCAALFPTMATFYLLHVRSNPLMVVACAWSSAVGLMVAFAAMDSLARHTTWLLGKTASGHISPWSWVIFWPYHLGLRIKLLVGSRITNEPLYTRIAPGWYLGGWASHPRHLPPGKTSVVDVTCELPRVGAAHTHKHYLLVPVWDTRAPTLAQLATAVDFCRAEAAGGRPVFVHCAHGHGRSATVMCAALIDQGLASGVDGGLAMMKGVRPRVNLSPAQRHVLELYVEQRAADGGEQQQQQRGGGTGMSVGGAGAGAGSLLGNGGSPLVIPSHKKLSGGSLGLVCLEAT